MAGEIFANQKFYDFTLSIGSMYFEIRMFIGLFCSSHETKNENKNKTVNNNGTERNEMK